MLETRAIGAKKKPIKNDRYRCNTWEGRTWGGNKRSDGLQRESGGTNGGGSQRKKKKRRRREKKERDNPRLLKKDGHPSSDSSK